MTNKDITKRWVEGIVEKAGYLIVNSALSFLAKHGDSLDSASLQRAKEELLKYPDNTYTRVARSFFETVELIAALRTQPSPQDKLEELIALQFMPREKIEDLLQFPPEDESEDGPTNAPESRES